jgi:hypothetical protein
MKQIEEIWSFFYLARAVCLMSFNYYNNIQERRVKKRKIHSLDLPQLVGLFPLLATFAQVTKRKSVLGMAVTSSGDQFFYSLPSFLNVCATQRVVSITSCAEQLGACS